VARVLSHTIVTAAGAAPRSWLFVLHGFFGAGRNWTTVGRRLTLARPDWGVALVDLRLHGASQGFAPPHTLAACAQDVAALAGSLGRPVRAVLGHSFGGKVALAYLRRRSAGLREVWVVDTDPSAGEPRGDAWELLRIVRSLPHEFGTRDELIAALGHAGIGRRSAEWMATNLDRTAAGYRWRLDFAALEQLLVDFFQTDMWGVLAEPPPGVEVHVVKALGSAVLADRSLARLRANAETGARIVLHAVEGGHVLNADNPDALAALLGGALPACA
jgi:esterase